MNGKHLLVAGALAAAAPVSQAAGSDDEGAGTAANLVAMDEIAVPIIDGARMEGTLRFRLVLQASDSAMADGLTSNLPVLRAEAIAAGAEFSRLSASPFLAVDARRLSADLTQALHARQPGIARVLLVEVAAKPA